MMLYLVKFIACSGLLLALYHLLLKNKAMYRFNRIFLLAGIVFSIAVPFIQFEQHVVDLPQVMPMPDAATEPVAQPATENYVQVVQASNTNPVPPEAAVSTPVVAKSPNYLLLIGLGIYSLVTGLLFYRFIKNLYKIRGMAIANERIDYHDAELVLIPQRLTPHSFFKYIFLNSDEYRHNKIEEKILHHELAHTRQYHSADVVFTELVQVFCWFNPFLILYRKSIQLNHEFLADAEVLDNYTDVKAYQYTLLSSLSATSGLNMTSQFSYALTKKRLLMMTRKTSLTTSILSRIATLLIVGIVFVVFCNATVSRKNESATKHITTKISNFDTTAVNQLIPFQSFVDIQHYEHTEKGVPQNLLDEYHAIIQKNQFKPGMTFKRWREMIGSEAELRMIAIYKQMSAEQQANEAVGFAYFNPPTPAYSITDAQLKAYKDPYIYLTYVNGYQGKRSKLGTYKAADLKKISFEKLTGEKWNYKVMLVTNKAYDDIYKEEVERKGKSAMIFKTPKGAVQTTIKPVPVTYANGKPFVPVIAPLQQKSTTKIVFPRPYPSTEAGVSQTLLDEYAAIIQKYEDTWGNIPPKERKLDEKDRAMLITIYRQMSLAQQAKQIITFQYGFPPSPSVKPTQAQINAFKDDHVYGVWIDDKKVANSELDKYKPADFGGVLISTLTKNAINYKRYRYEVSLMTVDFNNAMRKEISDKQYTDHMWTKMGPGGFAIKNDKYRVKKSASAVKVPNDDKVNAVTYIRPREGVPPTAAELAYYQRDDFYWVFINDKKIRNNQLSNYKPEELLRVYEKEPSQSGEVLSKYTNVVQFMTLDRYNKYHTTAMAL